MTRGLAGRWPWLWAFTFILLQASMARGYDTKFGAIVCDAGSTGTRAYTFWMENGEIKSKTGKKTKPGQADIDPKDAAEYLLPLFRDAKRFVPAEKIPKIPI